MRLVTPAHRAAARTITLDRVLEALPLFRLSDTVDDSAITYFPEDGGRWRALPAPGDRLPGTFDQDVYIEIMHRYGEAGWPEDGIVTFRLHAFLRSIARRVDGRTYEQLRSALSRLERTTLESAGGAYQSPGANHVSVGENGSNLGEHEPSLTFTILSSVNIERRRVSEKEQMPLFGALAASEPGDARVVIAPPLRANIAAGRTAALSASLYQRLGNPVARRLYRLLAVARSEDRVAWRVELDRLADQIPLTQRYPSQLQRVLQPAHEMLVAAGILRHATFGQSQRQWWVDYVLATRDFATRNIIPA